jgi:hypothetical protein
MKLLNEIQQKLKVPKGQKNDFGNYKYRSCEDILEAAKPLLGEATLTITDEIILIGDRYYVKALVTLSLGEESKSTIAYAREAFAKKGMDESQITGAASSYARKYALNGLFCIDDTRDADTGDNSGEKAFVPPSNGETKPANGKVLPPKANKKQQAVLGAIFENLMEAAPQGKAVDKAKMTAVIYSHKGHYPEDINKAKIWASWLIEHGKMNELCVDIPKFEEAQ